MTRTIKFRVWDGFKRMYYPSGELGTCNSGDMGMPCVTQNMADCEYLESYCNIQQFTGLKDKNGADIFEGDIIKYNFETWQNESNFGEVYYDEKCACFCFDRNLEYDFIRENMDIEVVGNVFENADLLK